MSLLCTHKKILLVDDEEELVSTLAERMRMRGLIVFTSTSAVAAVKRVEEEPFDTVVMDLMMPDMNGFEALKMLRELKPDLEVILLTGQVDANKKMAAAKLNASYLMEKPVDIQELTDIINRSSLR
ncbi:MAG: response regulator [Pseudomonadota bacterium]